LAWDNFPSAKLKEEELRVDWTTGLLLSTPSFKLFALLWCKELSALAVAARPEPATGVAVTANSIMASGKGLYYSSIENFFRSKHFV